MLRPLRRRPPIAPADVTIRHVGTARPTEVVSPATLLRCKEEAEWQRPSRARDYDLYPEHALLALAQADIVTVAQYTGDLWWFVRDVNGVERAGPGGIRRDQCIAIYRRRADCAGIELTAPER